MLDLLTLLIKTLFFRAVTRMLVGAVPRDYRVEMNRVDRRVKRMPPTPPRPRRSLYAAMAFSNRHASQASVSNNI